MTERNKRKNAGRADLVAKPKEEHVDELNNPYDGLSEAARHEQALADARSAWDTSVKGYLALGRILFLACYDGDAGAALEKDADKNQRFKKLARSLGTLDGGPNKKALSVARNIVAASKKVRGPFWKVVPYSHKEILLRLKDPDLLEEGAKFAVEGSWTLERTETWVDDKRQGTPKEKVKRGKTAKSTTKACDDLGEVAEEESLARIADDYEKLPERERRKMRESLDKAAKALQILRRRLSKIDG